MDTGDRERAVIYLDLISWQWEFWGKAVKAELKKLPAGSFKMCFLPPGPRALGGWAGEV